MATTSPDNLVTPDSGQLFNPVDAFQTLANTVQTALDSKVSKGPDPENINVPKNVEAGQDVSAGRDGTVGRNLNVAGNSRSGRVRVTSTTDLSLSSTGHGFQVGPDNGVNLGIDNNEIMARNNGGASTLYLNNDGGNVQIGNASSVINMPGRLNSPHLPYAMASGNAIITISSGQVNLNRGVTVTFPVNRFTKTPHVTLAPVSEYPGNINGGPSIKSVSNKSMLVYINRSTAVDTHVNWIAVQMS